MRRLTSRQLRRRSLLQGAAATSLAAATVLPVGGFAQGKTRTVNLQLGWLAGNNQIGEVSAKHLGYFEEEKLNVVIQPGGPSIDGVAIVASGRHEIGQVSSSPSLMLAASQKIPGDVLRHWPAAASLRLFLPAQEAGPRAARTSSARRSASRRPPRSC